MTTPITCLQCGGSLGPDDRFCAQCGVELLWCASCGEFRLQAEEFLAAGEVPLPEEFQRHARRFLYYQLFRASLPFEAFLEAGQRQGFVQLKPLNWRQLLPENSPTLRILQDGILNPTRHKSETDRQPFLLDEAA